MSESAIRDDTALQPSAARDFIRQRISQDVEAGCNEGRVTTRFPPEPNGHLHIGHVKSICLNFGIAQEFARAQCFLRFDDTNPSRESEEYVAAIMRDVRWLGFDWGERLTHASDYFGKLYEFALDLIRQNLAYVESLDAQQMREHRGTLTEPGRDSADRSRAIDENLDLFTRMRAGEFADGAYVLRAKIDMAAANINMRDPVMYRIMRKTHQSTADEWPIYPMYDFAHGLSDAIEGITHSLCTLEFEDHRPLYDWFLEHLDVPSQPQQIEFSRLNLSHTVMSKRMLNELVTQQHVDGWDDPRMPTISGLRRRGYTAAALRDFCSRIGVSKSANNVELAMLESVLREHLEHEAPRALAVLDPVKLIVENYPEDQEEFFDAMNHPGRPEFGQRQVGFCRELWIERADFMEDAPRKFFRFSIGREVRLRFAYYVTCTSVVKDPQSGQITEIRCNYDPESRGGGSSDGRKVKGTVHWVSTRHAVDAQVRLYGPLFEDANPGSSRHVGPLSERLSDSSLEVRDGCKLEASLLDAMQGQCYQFERQGYFCLDSELTSPQRPVFNRAVALRSGWAKQDTAK
ncbi:MAG: glutaminyl-tRNA synthetase [Gammaproteobacteria bacterium]|jgi:glutaminyl-tRNA synthetase